ncbi:MAG: hypothetical protein QM790_05865 [Nibricoccus sp.]
MSISVSTTTGADTTTPTTEKKPKARFLQSQAASNTITGALQSITAALEDPVILKLMSARAYDEPEFHVGLDFQASAQSAFDTRQKSPATKAEAKKLRDEAFDLAWEEFSDFRTTVKPMRKLSDSDKATLGATGKMTRDLQKFVTNATAAYQAAQKSPYTELLAPRSYTITWLNNAIARLKTVTDYDNSYTGAKALAKSSTEARNAAVDALDDWMREFRANAKIALKTQPVLLAKLGL